VTLGRLIDLLHAIPRDCHGLPVYLDVGDECRHCRIVVVNPPDPGDGGESCVTLANEMDDFIPPTMLLLERRRLPGTGE
jgi:hypothetical protein